MSENFKMFTVNTSMFISIKAKNGSDIITCDPTSLKLCSILLNNAINEMDSMNTKAVLELTCVKNSNILLKIIFWINHHALHPNDTILTDNSDVQYACVCGGETLEIHPETFDLVSSNIHKMDHDSSFRICCMLITHMRNEKNDLFNTRESNSIVLK